MGRVLFWTKGIDDVLTGDPHVAGIQVQQSRWALTFARHGWEVYCLSDNNRDFFYDLHFVKCKHRQFLIKCHFSLLDELLTDYQVLHIIKPNLVICRGSGRYLYLLSSICKLLKIKLVMFSASDVNYLPGKDTVNGSMFYTKLYRKSIKHISGFVVQNDFQANTLKKYYGLDALILPNIWIVDNSTEVFTKDIDCIWVSNLRRLKRAEWFVRAARKLNQYSFVMVGGALDQQYFEEIKKEVSTVGNIDFMGAQPMDKVNSLIARSRLLACTSEYEGFPNTFIQAWASNVPVVSTVNPSDLITRFNLGCVVNSEEEFVAKISALLSNQSESNDMVKAISGYFNDNHNSESAYSKLIAYLTYLKILL